MIRKCSVRFIIGVENSKNFIESINKNIGRLVITNNLCIELGIEVKVKDIPEGIGITFVWYLMADEFT